MVILIVDDDDVIRDSLRDFLESEGHCCYAAGSGSSALQFLDTQSPDLMITDVDMPNMDGVELLSRIRALPGQENLRVLVMSGSAHTSKLNALQDMWPIGVVRKPIKVPVLRRVLAQLVTGEPES